MLYQLSYFRKRNANILNFRKIQRISDFLFIKITSKAGYQKCCTKRKAEHYLQLGCLFVQVSYH